MSRTANIPFTVIAAEQIYTNNLTPVSAGPWPNRFESSVFPYSPVDYNQDNIIWDFGDGTTYRGVSAAHVYSWPGDYTITMSLIDETGEPVSSTQSYDVTVYDFIPTQIQFNNLKNVIDIPVGQKTNPIQVDFRLSWQNFTTEPRKSPQCPDGKQHLMNSAKNTATWMCGNEHPDVTEPPIYTFNLYASGSNSEPIDPETYSKNKYAHLEKGWSFFSTTQSTSAIPITSIDVTLLDPLTGNTGDPNTYELLYYKYENGEFAPVTPSTEGAVFVGLSGRANFYYKDDTIKCTDTRSDSIILTVELDETKLFDMDMVNKRNLSVIKYRNNKPLIISNIKPRVNPAAKLAITSNGLNEFQINKNKWENSEISFTTTIQDSDGFNILDSSTFDYNFCVKLVDSSGTPIDKSLYSITTVEGSQLGFYRGTLNCSTTLSNVQLSASLTYPQASGYIADAIVGWMNIHHSENDDLEEYGKLYRYFHADKYRFDPENLTTSMERFILGSGNQIETNGIISDAILVDPGKDMLAPPKIVLTDPTGKNADVVTRFDPVNQVVTDVVVLTGGINYTSPQLNYIVNEGATPPTIELTIDNNRKPSIIAVSLPDGENMITSWCIETGPVNRLLHVRGDSELLLSKPLSEYIPGHGTPNSIVLDKNKIPYVCTSNCIFRVNPSTYEHEIVVTSTDIKGLEIDNDYIYVVYDKHITRHEILDTSKTLSRTFSYSINSVLYVGNTTLYVSTTNDQIVRLNPTTMRRVGITIDLPSGEYGQLTTTSDGNVYTVRDNRYLQRIQKPTFVGNVITSNAELVFDFGVNSQITSICGDSRGYVWLLDDNRQKIIFVDCTVPEQELVINDVEDILIPGQINQSDYPLPENGSETAVSLKATGDWIGFHWLQKFGYVERETLYLEGTSNLFDVHSQQGTYNIRKFNEDHDHGNTLRSYALQPWLKENENLWETFIVTSVGDSTSEPTALGKLIYEKIANFIPNNNDIDDCNIDSIHNYALQYNTQQNIQMYNLNFPPTLKRVVDLCSIKHSRLFGAHDIYTDNFNMYEQYTEQETRKNLGYEVDFKNYMITPGETLVAYEKFSKIYTPIKTQYPLSGVLDNDDNVVSTGLDTNLVSDETQQYPLSSYTPFWRWGLIAPNTVTGEKILNYYSFWTYNQSTSANQVEGVINWNSPQTLLTPELSSYSDWEQDTGIVDNIIEHQIRQGISNFSLKSDQSYETILLFEVIGLDTHYFDWTGPCIEFTDGENAIVRFVDQNYDEISVVNEDGYLVWDPEGPSRHKFTHEGDSITLWYSQTAYTVTFTGFGLIINDKATN